MAGGDPSLKSMPLHGLHLEFGARMVPFAGYMMPVQYAGGILAEHKHTREAASLFDVSHMGQLRLSGDSADEALERLVPADLGKLPQDRLRYSCLTNEKGGVIDDLMIARRKDHLALVVNAARKEHDVAHLKRALGDRAELTLHEDRALIALQGPKAGEVIGRHAPGAAAATFMSVVEAALFGVECTFSRSGYTGEDGFEISMPADAAEEVARKLLGEPEVEPAGLGARDSLRLEAGLCLYGHELTEETTPVEAGLSWIIGKRRRTDGGFLGAEIILRQLEDGPPRKRVGLRPEGRAPARDGTEILNEDGREIGRVTSGCFGATVGGPIAMGYVTAAHAAPGTAVQLQVRGKSLPARVVKLPFVEQRYFKG